MTFSGPGGLDGGAILDESSNFGVSALSTPNFLAFNRGAQLSDGGIPTDPETISFAFDVDSVSIFASGGDVSTGFLMEAFDASNNLIASDENENPAGDWVQLTVAAAGIRSVRLTEVGGNDGFVYDNLSFAPAAVPEPGTLALLGAAGVGAMATLRRRRKARRATK